MINALIIAKKKQSQRENKAKEKATPKKKQSKETNKIPIQRKHRKEILFNNTRYFKKQTQEHESVLRR